MNWLDLTAIKRYSNTLIVVIWLAGVKPTTTAVVTDLSVCQHHILRRATKSSARCQVKTQASANCARSYDTYFIGAINSRRRKLKPTLTRFFFFFPIQFIILALLSPSLPVVTQTRGRIAGPSSHLSHYGTCLRFIR